VPRRQGGACDVGAFEVALSKTVLTAAPNQAAPTHAVTLTARVMPNTGTFHDPDAAAGAVTFRTGSTVLCSGKELNASGVATCSTTKLPPGTPTVTATFVSSSPYLASAGTAKPVIGTTPAFTSAQTARATVGRPTTITIHASGTPSPTITEVGGTLPKGMSFRRGTGSATISGTPAAGTAKTYVVHLRAANVRGSATQTLTLTVAHR
jgi:hypothetical protein